MGVVLFLLYVAMGRYQSGQLGQTVNLLAFAFVGSNPALPTGLEFFKATKAAGVAQLVEHQPSKLRVAGSSLVSRSCLGFREEERGRCSSGVERFLGKEEVMSSILIIGSDGGKGSRDRQL